MLLRRRLFECMAAGAAFGNGAQPKSGPLNMRDFGAFGDGSRDDAAAFRRGFASSVARRRPLYLPAGRYRIDSAIQWDVAGLARVGVHVFGDGAQLTLLDFTAAQHGPALVLYSSGLDSSGLGKAGFYSRLHDFGVQARGAGAVLQVGREDLSDVHNSYSIERLVVNGNSEGPVVTLNAVCGSRIDVVANGAGRKGGTALRLRQAQFCTFSGAQGNAGTGTWMGDGYNFGNVFTGIDYEVLGTAVSIAGSHCAHNTWIGGTMANLDWGFDCTRGHDNRVLNLNPGVPAARMVRGGVGLQVG